MAPLLALSSATVSIRPGKAVLAGPVKHTEHQAITVAPIALKLGEHLRTGAAAGAVALALAIAPAAQAVDTDYLQRIQAVEAEEVKEVLNGEGPPIAKDPTLAAYLSFGATAALTIGGANLFFSNSPTNRMWQAKKDEEKRKAEEAAKMEEKLEKLEKMNK